MSALFNLFYIYDPWLFHFFRMAFFTGVVACLALAYKAYKKQLTKGIFVPVDSIVVILSLIGVSIIPVLLHGTKDFSVVFMYCKTLILFIFGLGIYNLFYFNQQGSQRIIKDLKIGIVVQAVIGFVALAGLPFMIDLALSTNIVLPRFYGSEQEYRLYNLTSMAFFQLSAFYLMLLHFLLSYNSREKENGYINSIFLFLLLFIGLISGRTFLLLSVVSILIYFNWRYIPSLLLFAGICVFLAHEYSDNRYVYHALEPLINIIKVVETGQDLDSLSDLSSSTDTLVQHHLYMPEIKQILAGDGYYFYPEGGYYGKTDSGFLRQTLYGGFAYLIACFLFTAYFVYRIAQNWFAGSWKFILSTLAILSVLNIKADTYAFPGIMLVLLMFLSLFGTTGRIKVFFCNQGQN
ncbi:hypothetical protein BMT54_11310 [Pasteurellaceae bacterium 15-036681]|nr:hypothetical protein BMT54_11310 [Pasteurellaceae bacterium 15-036681]